MLTPQTRDDLVALCRVFTRDPDGTGRTSEEWTALINVRYADLIREAPLTEKETDLTPVAETDVIDLPDDFIVATLPSIFVNKVEMKPVASRTIATVRTASSGPGAYVLLGRQILFESKLRANTAVLARHAYLPAPLVDATDVPVIDPEFHIGLAYGATADAMLVDGQENKATWWEKRWQHVIARASSAYTSRKNARRSRGDEGD